MNLETRLDRIIARCEADLQTPAEFEGSGALITWRRATAIRRLADGERIPTVAGITGLSSERVAEVMANVQSFGIDALAASFDEGTPDGMSAAVRDAIRSAVGAVGIRRFSVAVFADRVVAAGIVDDISHRTLVEVLGTGRRTAPVAVAPTRTIRWALIIGLLFLVAFSLIRWLFLALWLALFTALFLLPLLLALYGLWSALQARRLRRAVEKASMATRWPAPFPEAPASSSDQPSIEVLNAVALPEPTVLPPPLAGEVLYLWIFDAIWSQMDLLEGGWAELAPTRMLANAELSSSRARRRALSSPRDAIIATPEQLDRAVDGFATDFGIHGSPNINVRQRSRRYVGYPVTTLICTAGMWHSAFDALLGRSGLVVVNLSGYDHAHEGLAHELRHVLRPPSPALEVFLIDAETDADAAIEFVIQIASAVGAKSRLVFVRTPAPDRLPSWSDLTAWLCSRRSHSDRRRSPDLADRVRAHLDA